MGDLRAWVLPPQNQNNITVKDRDRIDIFGEEWEIVGLITGNWRFNNAKGFVECVLRKLA